MAPHQLTNNFLERFKALKAYLETTNVKIEHFEIYDPVEEDVIEMIEEEIGRKIDEKLLAYFRESDGYELKYSFGSEKIRGSIHIPAFETIFFLGEMEVYSKPGEYDVQILGTKDDFEVRSNMYCFDRFNEDQNGLLYYAIYYLATENVLVRTNDYDACIDDAHPITVPSYFELCLATAGLSNRTQMLTRGYSNNHELIDFTKKDYEKLYPWSNSIAAAEKGLVTKAFYDLTKQATNEKGYNFRFMKF